MPMLRHQGEDYATRVKERLRSQRWGDVLEHLQQFLHRLGRPQPVQFTSEQEDWLAEGVKAAVQRALALNRNVVFGWTEEAQQIGLRELWKDGGQEIVDAVFKNVDAMKEVFADCSTMSQQSSQTIRDETLGEGPSYPLGAGLHSITAQAVEVENREPLLPSSDRLAPSSAMTHQSTQTIPDELRGAGPNSPISQAFVPLVGEAPVQEDEVPGERPRRCISIEVYCRGQRSSCVVQ